MRKRTFGGNNPLTRRHTRTVNPAVLRRDGLARRQVKAYTVPKSGVLRRLAHYVFLDIS